MRRELTKTLVAVRLDWRRRTRSVSPLIWAAMLVIAVWVAAGGVSSTLSGLATGGLMLARWRLRGRPTAWVGLGEGWRI